MHDCECRECECCRLHPGPAAFEITRDDKRMKVCTRCLLSGDADRKLIISKGEPAAPFFEWDPLGAFVIGFRLAEQEELN